jgi:hypothetical protein
VSTHLTSNRTDSIYSVFLYKTGFTYHILIVFIGYRGRFAIKLMKLKFLGPSLAWPPSKALGNVLVMPQKCSEILHIICERNLLEIFPGMTKILKIYMPWPIISCEAVRSFLNYQQ